MNIITPTDWTKLGVRDTTGGHVTLAWHLREAPVGPKRILIDEYVTWLAGPIGMEHVRMFDDHLGAAEDFATRS